MLLLLDLGHRYSRVTVRRVWKWVTFKVFWVVLAGRSGSTGYRRQGLLGRCRGERGPAGVETPLRSLARLQNGAGLEAHIARSGNPPGQRRGREGFGGVLKDERNWDKAAHAPPAVGELLLFFFSMPLVN